MSEQVRHIELPPTKLGRFVNKLVDHPFGRFLLRPLTTKRTVTTSTGESITERTIPDSIPTVVDVKVTSPKK